MSFEEIIDKTTIEFKRPIDLKETEDLLRYIAKNMPANINSTIKYFKAFIYNNESKGILENKGTLEVIAGIHNFKTHAFDALQSVPDNEDTFLISSVAFQRVPDWEIFDYRPEVQELWGQTRELVNKYFEEIPKEKLKENRHKSMIIG